MGLKIAADKFHVKSLLSSGRHAIHDLNEWPYVHVHRWARVSRTRVARVRAEYPDQLDYSGFWRRRMNQILLGNHPTQPQDDFDRIKQQRIRITARELDHRRSTSNRPAEPRGEEKHLAPWPNGSGIGLRSRGLQVRILPGSYLVGLMIIGLMV